ncbi:phage tail terminator-like protein [Methylorubrum sp. SB2]|uniref:phage tail terminator-like protein n=1 Tax=Methylorubrum subtropicum TaxID=3138812 RepID=UPI00313EAC4C
MALSAVSAAVEGRLKAWSGAQPGRPPVRGLNTQDAETPADNSAYLEVHYPVSTSEQISMGAPGANVWRDEGAFRVLLNVESGSGVVGALALVDEIAALFRGKNFDGVRCFAPSQPVIDDRNDAGGWFTLSFAVPYEHDIIA